MNRDGRIVDPMRFDNALTRQLGISLPIIGGAMYPCSNPELVAAVSEAGGIGVVQPLSLVFVHGRGTTFRQGLRGIRELTRKPIGMNVLTEKTSRIYLDRMSRWLDEALEEGVRFFVSSLGDPRWIVERVRKHGGVVYHDVTERKWALKALEGGVDGLICVNARAGGHAGTKDALALLEELANLGVPLVCAGGVSTAGDVAEALALGYVGAQIGTRLIATHECSAHADYKAAIVRAREEDIVLTEKISGVPVAIIRTPAVERMGTRAGPVARWMLRHPKYKHWMRSYYSVRSLWELRGANLKGSDYKDYWQAGRSVRGIDAVESVAEVMARLARGLPAQDTPPTRSEKTSTARYASEPAPASTSRPSTKEWAPRKSRRPVYPPRLPAPRASSLLRCTWRWGAKAIRAPTSSSAPMVPCSSRPILSQVSRRRRSFLSSSPRWDAISKGS